MINLLNYSLISERTGWRIFILPLESTSVSYFLELVLFKGIMQYNSSFGSGKNIISGLLSSYKYLTVFLLYI